MGNIIQLYEPGPLSAIEPYMHVGFLSHCAEYHLFVATWKGATTQLFLVRKIYELNMWMWRS